MQEFLAARKLGVRLRGWLFHLLFSCCLLMAAAPQVFASCAGMVERQRVPSFFHPHVRLASTDNATTGLARDQLHIRFIGHSTFEVESPEGALVHTDYNDYVQGERTPHIVTMNNAHNTHYSVSPDSAIPHVLRGWDPAGGIARHDLRFRDIRVRNVPTNLRDMGGGRLANGNSMFVIEAVGLCVVHISHLHHYLSRDQLRELGIIDVAFAPIDGMWTMSHDELFRVLTDLRARLVIPMHYGSMTGVEAFVARAKKKWPVRWHNSDMITVSLRTVPRKPEVLFLQGR